MTEQEIKENIKTYSVIKSIIRPLWYMSENINMFIKLSSVFVVLLTILAYLFGKTYFCAFPNPLTNALSCDISPLYIYLIYLLCKIILMVFFMQIWLGTALEKQLLNKENILNNRYLYLKSVGWFFIFLILNSLPVISGLLLLFRVPNPVWQIELIYFTVVSIGFIVPFIMMRIYAVFADLLNAKGFVNLKKFWKNTVGCGLKIVFSAAVFFFGVLLLFLIMQSALNNSTAPYPEIYNLLAEIIFNFVMLFICALFINFIKVQNEMLVR